MPCNIRQCIHLIILRIIIRACSQRQFQTCDIKSKPIYLPNYSKQDILAVFAELEKYNRSQVNLSELYHFSQLKKKDREQRYASVQGRSLKSFQEAFSVKLQPVLLVIFPTTQKTSRILQGGKNV